MKYLVAGLGNIGEEYKNTRHNIGFKILDALALASNISFKDKKKAFYSEYKFKGRTFILIKPTTYMNLSGKAVNYYLQQEKIDVSRLLVITDDLNLPFGKQRLKAKGSDGGHNGLKSINESLGTDNYARLRFGVGNNFYNGKQIDYVLGEWEKEEADLLNEKIDYSIEIIKSFGALGIERTMNLYNKK